MRGKKRLAARTFAAIARGCAAAAAHAAGGHHGVDDAEILPRGECEQETWFSRAREGERLLHAGLNCRVGPFELGGAGEHVRSTDESGNAWNLEVKWAREIADGLSVGLDLQPTWLAHRNPRFAGTRVAALATWKAMQTLALHVNAGRSFVRGGRDLPNGGIAAEWTHIARWSFVAERYLESETHFVRGGARWAAGRQWTVDLSYARRLSGPVPSLWTLGLTIDLDDD
jgi:hypothetical protein